MWFETKQIHSLAEWVVYMFECEIKQAYLKRAPELYTLYQYTCKNYDTDDKINKLLETTIIRNFATSKAEDPNYKNSINFYFTKCVNRLKEAQNKHEYLTEYNWYYDGKNNQISQVFSKACEEIEQNYRQWKDNRILYDLLEQEEMQKTAKKNKKDKKKKKKEQQSTAELEEQHELEEKEVNPLKQIRELRMEIEDKIFDNLDKQPNVKQQIKYQEQPITPTKPEKITKPIAKSAQKASSKKNSKTQQVEKSEKIPTLKEQVLQKTEVEVGLLKIDKHEEEDRKSSISQTPSHNASQISSLDNERKKNPQLNKNKKIIRSRINEYYQQYVDGLSQDANAFEKYRKLTFKVVEEFLTTLVFGKSEFPWKLNLYGSAAAGFALKQSDVDLLLQVDTRYIGLQRIYEILKMQMWAIDCKYIQAQIPLINFGVSLRFSEIAAAQLQPRHLKKIQNQIFSVDLTISSFDSPHSGIENTNHLRELFESYPPLRTICLLYKEHMRMKSLNKPYKGGISSYVLVMLVYSILSRQNMLSSEKADYCTQIRQITRFMLEKFRPFQTVISCEKVPTAKVDPTIHLNIEHPKNRRLLKTSAFQIHKIIQEIRKMGEFQNIMEEKLRAMPIIETKNMKKFFMQSLQDFVSEAS